LILSPPRYERDGYDGAGRQHYPELILGSVEGLATTTSRPFLDEVLVTFFVSGFTSIRQQKRKRVPRTKCHGINDE